MTGHYFSIAPAAVVGCDEPFSFAKITTFEYSRTVKTTKCFATVTGYKIICSKVKILKRQTVTTSVLFTFKSVEKAVLYNIRNS